MFAVLPLLLLFATPPSADAPVHKIDVRIAGPLAMVEVWRTVEANVRASGEKQIGTFLDLDLPEGTALLDWEVIERNARTRLSPLSEVEANAGLGAALKMRRLSLPAAPADESVDVRVHVIPLADGERAVLHYRYSALVACRDGRLVLRMPESLEENPIPAEVSVTIEPLPGGPVLAEASLAARPMEIRSPARRLVMHGPAPARAAWEIGWSYARGTATIPGQVLAAAAQVPGVGVPDRKGRARGALQYELAGLLCRTETTAKQEPPLRVILLVDRSRSMGQSGLSAGRALARSLVEALPPSVQFNAILFGSTATPLYVLPRMPTREVLDAFTSSADPNRLDNGTDVVAALHRARVFHGDGAGRTWIVLVTDGALPATQTFERMQAALAGAGEQNLRVMVLLVRPSGDDEVPASSVAEYAQFARKFGGLVRVLPPGGAGDTARALIAAMARGGDLLDVRLESVKLSDALPPGQGASAVFTDRASLPRDKRVRLSARGFDGSVQAEILPVLVKREWLDPLVENSRAAGRAWSGATSGMALAVLPATPLAKKAGEPVVRGRMDPLVLRNALALAFLPRARACYLSRRVAKAGDAELRGRVKLELSIERGELHDAVVRESTLGNPAIESCVRAAAFAVDYPRPEHRDAPTVANLNLVFQPRTAREGVPDASPADREIELILGPLTFTTDFTDLLENK
jgi:hypothetical protein